MANKKVTIGIVALVVIIILGIIAGAVGYHYYQEKNKSGWVKGAEKVEKVFTGK